MAQKRKLQVFISSTYTDLSEERQAAVHAILTAGHIPAGMELFAAGDEMQMAVIRRWIDESDVFLLILAGRYGSIEPTTGKSYIQLEYEYAISKKKPLFAVVVSDEHLEEKVKKFGRTMIETDEPQKLKSFRELVCKNMVRFWSDPRDIKLAILETLADLSLRDDLIGWIPGSEAVDSGALAEEMARLTKENNELRERVQVLSRGLKTYAGLTFDEMYKLLASDYTDLSNAGPEEVAVAREIATAFGDSEPAHVHLLWAMSDILSRRISLDTSDEVRTRMLYNLIAYGLVEKDEKTSKERQEEIFGLTTDGREFLVRLRLERDVAKVQHLVIPPN